MIKYSLIIPVYAHNIEHFLDIIKSRDDIELIIILTKKNPTINCKNIKIIKNFGGGYADSINKGIKSAVGEYCIIANDDIFFDEYFFVNLDALNKNIVVPIVYDYYNKKIESFGSYINFLFYNKLNRTIKNDTSKLHITGSVFIIKKSIYEHNKMDESYFMYYEDTDLSVRLKKRYNIIFSSNLIVYHKHSFSGFTMKKYYLRKNRIIFLLKNFKNYRFLIILFLILTEPITIIMQSIIDRNIFPLKARIDALKLLKRKM